MSPRRPHPFGRVASSIALRTRGSVAVAITAAVTTAVGVGVCTAAQAAGEPSFSIGVAAGPAGGRVDCVASFPCDRASSQFKLSGAWNFADAWDAQLAYFRAGRFLGGDPIPAGGEFGGTFRVDGVGLTAGYHWTFAPGWSVIARLGAASVRTRFEYANALAGDVSKTTLQPLGGVGIGYAVTPALQIGVDYDVTRFKVYRKQGSLRALGIAAQFSF